MISSLRERSKSKFHIYVLAMDDESINVLKDFKFSDVTVFSLSEFENAELLSVKKDRSLAEYCWTCTPAVIRYVLKTYSPAECTYIDADLFFFNDPEILLKEARESNKSVLITPHNYSRFFDQTEVSGIFCVQFMYFKNDEKGSEVLENWYKKCIEWCYARVEEGKFGDQKYLDVWPRQFSQVQVLGHLGSLAPWNVQNYEIFEYETELLGARKGKKFQIVFYHFHGLHLIDEEKYFLGWYPLSKTIRKKIYEPYLDTLLGLQKILKDKYSFIQTPYKIDKSHYWIRVVRKIFFETFYFIFRVNI